jgi:predicted amidophosphoribosyltransferase
MQCSKCGQEVDPSDVFCRGCGQALGTSPPATKVWKAGPVRVQIRTVTHVICGGCRKEVPLGEKTCPSCGRPMPSEKEIEQKLKQATKTVTTSTEKVPVSTLACPYCGGQIDLAEGKCKSCGKPLYLSAPILDAVRKAASGAAAQAFTLGPIRAGASVKIGLSRLAAIFFAGGLLVFLAAYVHMPAGGQHAAPQLVRLQGYFSPFHFIAFALWGIAVILLLVQKFQD